MRKALNDAAYRGLDYVAFDPNMPITKEGCPTDEAKFMWVSLFSHSTLFLSHVCPDGLLNSEVASDI
jgi:hypothetical protein